MFCKKSLPAFVVSALVERTIGSGIIFPLYVDPGSGCSAWEPLITEISAFPDLPWYIIINPDSGPGSSPPSKQYQNCVPQLRVSGSDVIVLGYADTANGTKDPTSDINSYASWGAAYRPDGIFFDDVSSSAQDVSLYQGYAQYARSKFATFITLNPGTTPAVGYYSIADQIVTFEDLYSNFSPADLTISSSAPAAKQAVILYEGPSTPPSSTIQELAQLGIGAVYFTDDGADGNPYDSYPSNWDEEVQEVAAAN